MSQRKNNLKSTFDNFIKSFNYIKMDWTVHESLKRKVTRNRGVQILPDVHI